MKSITLLIIILPSALGWMYQPANVRSTMMTLKIGREQETTDNPCWQDLYDDDCSMSSIAAASFVASKWIKSMPCAAGIEVSIHTYIVGVRCIFIRKRTTHICFLAFRMYCRSSLQRIELQQDLHLLRLFLILFPLRMTGLRHARKSTNSFRKGRGRR
jgi:hypothetical protein